MVDILEKSILDMWVIFDFWGFYKSDVVDLNFIIFNFNYFIE